MKKFMIFALVLVLVLSLCACGRKNNTNTTPSTANPAPSTNMNILPDTMPTLDTNIPDPNVDTQMPGYTDGTGAMDNFTAGSTN